MSRRHVSHTTRERHPTKQFYPLVAAVVVVLGVLILFRVQSANDVGGQAVAGSPGTGASPIDGAPPSYTYDTCISGCSLAASHGASSDIQAQCGQDCSKEYPLTCAAGTYNAGGTCTACTSAPQATCTNARANGGCGWYWVSGACSATPAPSVSCGVPSVLATQTDCTDCGYVWQNGQCTSGDPTTLR